MPVRTARRRCAAKARPGPDVEGHDRAALKKMGPADAGPGCCERTSTRLPIAAISIEAVLTQPLRKYVGDLEIVDVGEREMGVAVNSDVGEMQP